MTIIHLDKADIRPGIYGDKILIPNAKEFSYIRECHCSSRENWKWTRGAARLKYRPVWKALHG